VERRGGIYADCRRGVGNFQMVNGKDADRLSTEAAAFEKHYRISELARIWGLGRETIRRLVKEEPGVIKIRMGRRKAHTTYSVPESVARRIHTRLLNAA
jgi:hypothetical protein